MADGKRLAKLKSALLPLINLVEDCVRIIVKALHIAADQKQEGISRAAEIQFRCIPIVRAVGVARR